MDVLDLIEFEMKQTKEEKKKVNKKFKEIKKRNKPVKVLVSEMSTSDDLIMV